MIIYKNYSLLGEVYILEEGEPSPAGIVPTNMIVVHIVKYIMDRYRKEAVPETEWYGVYPKGEGTGIEVALGLWGFTPAG